MDYYPFLLPSNQQEHLIFRAFDRTRLLHCYFTKHRQIDRKLNKNKTNTMLTFQVEFGESENYFHCVLMFFPSNDALNHVQFSLNSLYIRFICNFIKVYEGFSHRIISCNACKLGKTVEPRN